jgi:hypothetical protein
MERREASLRRHPTLWLWVLVVPTISTLKALFPHGGFNEFTQF